MSIFRPILSLFAPPEIDRSAPVTVAERVLLGLGILGVLVSFMAVAVIAGGGAE